MLSGSETMCMVHVFSFQTDLNSMQRGALNDEAHRRTRPPLAPGSCRMSRPRRVLGYARVSSVDQAQGTSLQDQQNAIAAYAKARGLTVSRFFVEAESAVHEKIERRDQMRALMADVRAGDLVLCDKLDRWSRDPEFTYSSVRKILATPASFYAVGDRCDPSTSEGDTALGFRVLFAREEHKRIKERTVGTRKLLRDRGYYVEGQPPLGYRRAEAHGLERHALVIVEREAALVRRIFRLAASGRSLMQIVAHVEQTRRVVRGVLSRRLYLGEIANSRGEWIAGRHPAIVDAQTFAAARAGLEARRSGGPRPREVISETTDWMLRDVATCAMCGHRMGSATARKGEAKLRYYRCSHRCTSRYVAVKSIDAKVEPLVVARLVELKELLAEGPAPVKAPVIDLVARREKLERRRAKYIEAFADDSMTRSELRERMAKLDAERLALDAEQQKVISPPLASAEVRREILRDVAELASRWARAGGATKRAAMNILAVQVRMRADAPPVVIWKTPEDLALGESER